MKDSAGKPHVLIVVENLPVPIDRRVWQESCALRDAGYDVSVICPRMRDFVEPFEEIDGIRIHRHWISGEAGSVVGFLAEYTSALWGELLLATKIWSQRPFQIIHLCNPPDLLFLVALPFKLLGVRVIYDVHDAWPEMFEAKFRRRGLAYAFVRIAERLTYAVADVVLATNASVREIALKRGRKPPDRVFIVRTAPKISATDVTPNPEILRGRRFLVGYIGVMGNADGVEHVIHAADILVNRRKRTDIQFLLMGSGPEYPALVSLRDRLNLGPFVDMPGRVSDSFLFSALKTMDLGVSCDPKNPYNDHCTMNKVLEYMAFEKPQVMFDLTEGRASAGDASVYVHSGANDEFADAIEMLLADPARRATMGSLGLERLQTLLGWDRSVEQLKAAYRSALGPSPQA
jgi:glycosyltransferase involved in cell wall biosynthesis